jgi:hypothetical protein
MSLEGFSESVGLFLTPPTEAGIENKSWINIRPTSQITEGGTIDFNVPGNTLKYMSLYDSRFYVKSRIVKKDGTAFGEDEFASPVNLFLHSLWSQMDVSIQQVSVSSGVSTKYPMKALIDYTLGTTDTEWNSSGACQMYYRDNWACMDDWDPAPKKLPINSGLFARYSRSKKGKIFDMEGPLYSDIFQQKRLLLNGLQLGVKLYPSQDSFRLMCKTNDYKVEILDAILKVCYVKVSPGILLGHSEALKIGPAMYFYDESIIKSYAIASGQYGITVDDLFQGEVPKTLTLCLASSEAMNGSCKRNPFNFKNYNLDFCSFYVDGQSYPTQALQPSFGNSNYVEAYLRLFNEQPMNGITYEEFGSGYTIYTFTLREKTKNILSVRRRGHTRLELRFSDPLAEPVTLLAYGKFGQVLSVDQSRNVKLG